MREKVGKSRNTVFFQWFEVPEGRKVGSLKRRVRSQLARWEMKKLHAVVARSTFPSQNVQNTPLSDHFWKLRCRKSARRCGAKHISKSNHTNFGAPLEVEMLQKCTPLWHEAHFQVKMLKTSKHHMLGPLLDGQMSFRVAGARDCAPCQKWAKREGFVSVSKVLAGVGHLKWICKNAFSVAGAMQETCSSEMLGGPGGDFLWGFAFWSIKSSVLGRWFCVTGAALRMTWRHFSWQALYFRQVDWKNRKTHWQEAVSSALNFPLLKERSQNCFVLDVANFKNWGRLAELLHFWRYQVQKLRKSHGSAAFLMLSSSKMEEVSQNSFVLKLAGRQIDRLTTTTTTTTALKYNYNCTCKCITLPCTTIIALHYTTSNYIQLHLITLHNNNNNNNNYYYYYYYCYCYCYCYYYYYYYYYYYSYSYSYSFSFSYCYCCLQPATCYLLPATCYLLPATCLLLTATATATTPAAAATASASAAATTTTATITIATARLYTTLHQLHCSALQLQIQSQLQLHYITQHYTTLINMHYTTTTTATTLHCTTLHYNYNYTTLHYTTLDGTTIYHSTVHNTTVHYTTLFTPHHNYNCNSNCNYTTLYNCTTLQLQVHYATLQLQLQLHYTTLHPAVVVRWPLQPLQPLQKSTTFRSISGFALPSMHHHNQPLL